MRAETAATYGTYGMFKKATLEAVCVIHTVFNPPTQCWLYVKDAGCRVCVRCVSQCGMNNR